MLVIIAARTSGRDRETGVRRDGRGAMGALDGKVAVVTGAGQGIGRGIARRLAGAGASVLVAELNPETAERVATELRDDFSVEAGWTRTDVTDKQDVTDMVATAERRWGGLDVLVNNAWGGGGFGRIEWKDDAEIEHGLKVGFWGAYWAMQASFPILTARGGGSIVNLCSLNGVNAHLYTVDYNTAKEAIRAFSRTAAREWARHGIRVNMICPAAVTPAYEMFRQFAPENAAELLAMNPMGRMGDPEADIGGVAVFLASDDSRYLTGNTLFVDGGSHINGVSWDPGLPDDPPG